MRFVDNIFGEEVYGLISIFGVVGNNVVANLTFVEKGCGKVASCVGTYNLKDPYNTAEFYNFKSWDKLNNMMIEIVSHPIGYKPPKHPEKWYTAPEGVYKEGLKELEKLRKLGVI